MLTGSFTKNGNDKNRNKGRKWSDMGTTIRTIVHQVSTSGTFAINLDNYHQDLWDRL